ncbi:hypothetical protein ACFQX8_28875 [Klenkia terrae]|uniref:hypothetical protein n=1 Tax=Klenkia terrae TaxID=1052259 RepID=UPI003618F227
MAGRRGARGEGTSAYRLHQGAAVRRPSVLDGTVVVQDGRAVAATVAGRVHPVASGTIAVPA